MDIHTASHIIEAIGQDVFVERFGFNERLLRHTKSTDKFAANRYREIKQLCDERGIPCPLSAFNWKVSDKLSDNAAPVVQGVPLTKVNEASA